MRLLERIFGRERRDAVPRHDPSWRGAAGYSVPFGTIVTPEAAQAQVGVVFACISLIASSLAGVPIEVFRRRQDGAPEHIPDSPLAYLLNIEPIAGATAFEAREGWFRDLLTGGNAYAGIDRDKHGAIIAIRPYPAPWISVELLSSARLRYTVSPPLGGSFRLLADEMLHARGPSRDGVMGQSPIALARGAVALAMSQAGLADSQASRGFVPTLSFTAPDELSQEQYDRLQSGLSDLLARNRVENRPLVLESSMKPERLSATSQEADFLAARKLGLQDVCRLFAVPPSVVGLADRAPYATAEAEARAFVTHALAPWSNRLEQALARVVFTPRQRQTLFIRHNLDPLRQGDVKSRFDAYAVAVTNGILSANEARAEEGYAPRPGGDDFLRPLNMASAT